MTSRHDFSECSAQLKTVYAKHKRDTLARIGELVHKKT